ncbi:MAG: hypothetical protein GF355_17025 [Candidatus Eisenbacteria bacterium]|nr:hypothetical protein [Candidatus Eisenbacteria bacterium]
MRLSFPMRLLSDRVKSSLRSRLVRGPGLMAILVLLGALWGCDSEAPPPPDDDGPPIVLPRSGGTVRLVHQEPSTLDPLLVDDVYEAMIANQIYDGLVKFNSSCMLCPHLAETWTVSPDGRRYTFTLRPGVRFSNGQRLCALDVVVTFASILSPTKEAHPFAETYLEAIDGAPGFQQGRAPWPAGLQAPDSLLVRIDLREPLATFLPALTMDQSRILPWQERIELVPGGLKALDGHVADDMLAAARRSPRDLEHPGLVAPGSGPFLPVEWVRYDHVTLVRNEKYWGPQPGVDSLLFLAREAWEADEIVQLFLDREVEMTFVPRGREAELVQEANAQIDRAHEMSFSFIGFRTDQPPFNQILFRRAFAHAINVEKLAGLDPDIAQVATGILPPGMPGYSPEPKRLAYDPGRARQLLAELGYGAGNPVPPCTLYTSPGSDPEQPFDKSIQNDLRTVGIPATTVFLEWTELDTRAVEGDLPVFSFGWIADLPDPDSIFYFLFHSQGDNNLFSYKNPEVDRLIEEARVTRGAARWDIYRRLESIILADVPIIPLRVTSQLTAWQPYVKGVPPSPLGTQSMAMEKIRLVPGLAKIGDLTAEGQP